MLPHTAEYLRNECPENHSSSCTTNPLFWMHISPPLQTFVIFLHFSSDIPKSLEKIGSWLWGGILDWCPKLSSWVLHGQWGGQPGCEPQPGTHCYHCPQNNLFQRKDVSHLCGSGEKFKNIKQILPKSLEKKKQKWQKLSGVLELQIEFKSHHFWSLSSLLCLRNHFQMTQLAMPMSCSTAIFFSLPKMEVTTTWENIPWQVMALSGPSYASFREAAKLLRKQHF